MQPNALLTWQNFIFAKSGCYKVPELLIAVTDKTRELMKKRMLRASSLTLGILKSLYPRADLDVAKEGFARDCDQARASKLVKDSVAAATEIIEMIQIK